MQGTPLLSATMQIQIELVFFIILIVFYYSFDCLLLAIPNGNVYGAPQIVIDSVQITIGSNKHLKNKQRLFSIFAKDVHEQM